MTAITLAPPIVKEKNTTAEPKVGTAIEAIQTFINTNKLDGATNIKLESIKEENLVPALQVKIAEKNAGLAFTKQAGSTTAVTGNFYLMETNATTLTLPAATISRTVGIACLNSIASVKLKTAAGVIYGDFVNGLGEVVLLTNQHLIVQADGTNWHIISGESKREQGYAIKSYTKVEAETGVIPSTTRPAFVNLVVVSEAAKAVFAELTVEGVIIGEVQQASNAGNPTRTPCAVKVNPGQRWKLTAGATGLTGVEAFTLLE